ncbi:ATP-binding protein [Georgenia muralis]
MRRLLLLYGLAMTTAVLVAFLIPLGLLARSLAQERALDAGRQDAQGVAVFAGGVAADAARLEAAVLDVNAGPRTTTVFRPDGSLVGPAAPVSTAVEVAAGGRALTARTDGGVEVLLPVGGADGVSVVRTFVPDGELTAGVAQAWLVLAGVGAVVLAATVTAADRIAARLSRSVLDLATVAGRLGAGDLTARVEPSGPREVVAVGHVLNGLGARVSALLADERELVADLSHRLRTPITALRLDTELLTDPAEREQVTGHVDQLVAGLDAVLWAARHPAHEGATGRCDAAAVVRERGAFWEVLASEQGRVLTVEAAGPAEVAVGADELGAALDVLIDNVFSHTPDGTAFRLAVERDAVGTGDAPVVRVVVEDDGPGFVDLRLAERGRSGAGSTGLGLDVARRTAERAGGRLVLGNGATGGARIVLELPALREP